jgi:hypothetical protein
VLKRTQTRGSGARFGACHGDGSVVAERRWRARGERRRRQGGRGAEVGEVGGDAWACVAAGGGARGPAPAVSGGGRSRAEGEAAVTEEEEAGWCQQD